MSDTPLFPRVELAPGYSISRVIKGSWQLAGGHGRTEEEGALEDMRRFVAAGITTFDCADIYTGVEILIGRFLRRFSPQFESGELPAVQVHTKFVPDLNSLASLSWQDVESGIDRSLRRLGCERLDLVQFHWWDFSIPGCIEAALHLDRLRRAGKIRHIGLTNFDACHARLILEAGVPVVSNQIQYSLLDRRPAGALTDLAEEKGLRLLGYGVLAGGFLTDRFAGLPDPGWPLENRSLVKYRLIIDEFGGYDLFQELLGVLKRIAGRRGIGIAELALRIILDKRRVAGVIVGARDAAHLSRLRNFESVSLETEELLEIEAILARSAGPRGPVYGLERDREGRHGRIMRYNLNRAETE